MKKILCWLGIHKRRKPDFYSTTVYDKGWPYLKYIIVCDRCCKGYSNYLVKINTHKPWNNITNI